MKFRKKYRWKNIDKDYSFILYNEMILWYFFYVIKCVMINFFIGIFCYRIWLIDINVVMFIVVMKLIVD